MSLVECHMQSRLLKEIEPFIPVEGPLAPTQTEIMLGEGQHESSNEYFGDKIANSLMHLMKIKLGLLT